MDINNQRIDWNQPDVLIQVLENIKGPLNSIMEANQHRLKQIKSKSKPRRGNASEIIFSSSQEISKLIKEVIKVAKSKSTQPYIFQIYQDTPNIQSSCKKQISSSKISKTDQTWLINFEKKVFEQIKRGQINLFDLSYNLAISERQLHRKIKSLTGLTPNKYIRALRLYKAKELIDQYTYDTISEISYRVGYFDTHYFSKLFHQQYNTFPKELLLSKK